MSSSLEKWQTHLETGVRYLGEGKSIEAEGYLKESLYLAEMLEVPIIIAFTQRLLATAQVRNQKLEEAEIGFNKALKYCLRLNNNKGIAEAKAGLASIAIHRGEYRQSIYLYQQAIRVYPQDASALRLAVLYSDLGQVYARMKEWKHAEEAYVKAENLCGKFGYRRGEAEISLYLGEVYYTQGKLKMATTRFSMAARLFASIAEELSLANALHYLAMIFLEKKKIEEALLFQYRVIILYLKYEQHEGISEGYYLLSNILQVAGLYEEAEKALHLSLHYYSGDEFGLAARYHSLAVMAVIKKQQEQAKEYYFKALKHFQFNGDGSKIGEISEELTYLIQYEDTGIQAHLYQWLGDRNFDVTVSSHEVMVKLAYILKRKGDNVAALRCGWRALAIAKEMKYETIEIETLIQALSERIRNKVKDK